jgi:hypothetical protein
MESQERSEWVRELRELYQAYDEAAPQYRKGRWTKVFQLDSVKELFELPLQHEQFEYDTVNKRDDIWTRITSKSYIAVLDKEEQHKLYEKIENVLEDPTYQLPKHDSHDTFTFPHDTDLFWCSSKK